MGHVLKLGLELGGSPKTKRLNPDFAAEFSNLKKLEQNQPGISKRERLHVDAVLKLSEGYFILKILSEGYFIFKKII